MVEGKWGHGCPQIDRGIIVESLALSEIKVVKGQKCPPNNAYFFG